MKKKMSYQLFFLLSLFCAMNKVFCAKPGGAGADQERFKVDQKFPKVEVGEGDVDFSGLNLSLAPRDSDSQLTSPQGFSLSSRDSWNFEDKDPVTPEEQVAKILKRIKEEKEKLFDHEECWHKVLELYTAKNLIREGVQAYISSNPVSPEKSRCLRSIASMIVIEQRFSEEVIKLLKAMLEIQKKVRENKPLTAEQGKIYQKMQKHLKPQEPQES